MKDSTRIKRILGLIEMIWEKEHDLRFNQLIEHLSWQYSDKHNDAYKEHGYSMYEENNTFHFKRDFVVVDLFHLEDDKFEDFLVEYIEKYNGY